MFRLLLLRRMRTGLRLVLVGVEGPDECDGDCDSDCDSECDEEQDDSDIS